VALADVATLWSDGSPQFDLTVIDAPDQLGSGLAHAVARTAIHAPRADLLVDVARWGPFIAALSSESPSAGGLQPPRLRALGGHPSILNPVTMPPNDLAAEINRALDRWVLDVAHRRLTRYIGQREDPGHAASFVAAADLRRQMDPIWQNWVQRFQGDSALLTRFLGLAVCAKDEPAAAGEASALAGRLLVCAARSGMRSSARGGDCLAGHGAARCPSGQPRSGRQRNRANWSHLRGRLYRQRGYGRGRAAPRMDDGIRSAADAVGPAGVDRGRE
jgi:hypothetical protein